MGHLLTLIQAKYNNGLQYMTITITGGMNVTGGAYFGPQVNVNCDPYYASVSLLLHCDGSGAVSVGNLLDSGPNTNTPSSISSGTINYYSSPVKWGVSSIAGGGGPYVLYNDSSLWDFGAGDFTVECWAYAQSVSGGFFTGFTRFFIGRAAPSLSATTASWGSPSVGGTLALCPCGAPVLRNYYFGPRSSRWGAFSSTFLEHLARFLK